MSDDDFTYESVFASAVRKFAGLSYAESVKKLAHLQNLFYSPLSIVTALSALHVGTKGSTSLQIEHLLGLTTADAVNLPSEFKKFALAVDADDGEQASGEKPVTPLRVANSLAVEQSYAIEQAFVSKLQSEFGSALINANFVQNTESARQAINQWVSDKTLQKIPELIPSGVLSHLTRLVIVNAVHFDANWMNAFDKRLTHDADFHLLSDQGPASTSVKMMSRNKAKLTYWTNAPNLDWPEAPASLYSDVVRLSIVSLPYIQHGREPFEMLVILPDERDGLRKLETLLQATPDSLNDLLTEFYGNARRRDVNLKLPSFRFAEELPLTDLLKQLGATDMFEQDKANLCGISKDGDLYVAAALHKAVIDVDEKGTRAAAATAIAVNTRCMPIVEPTVDFCVDHPCIFIIAASFSRIPLFVGRLVQPKHE